MLNYIFYINFCLFSHALHIKWLGFHDPHSGIKSYHWCVGYHQSTCDVISLRQAHTSLWAIEPNLNLPLNTDLFCSVWAENNVNLTSMSVSQKFQIDISPPKILKKVTLSTWASIKANTLFDRSFLSASWLIYDDDIPMTKHHVSLRTYQNTKSLIDVWLVGAVQNVTINLNKQDELHDGCEYVVIVTSCNAAALCNMSESEPFLVDSSQPSLGEFVEPMTWRQDNNVTTFNLSWLGFDDPHSKIQNYYILISSSYSGFDLLEEVFTVSHNNFTGKQHTEINLVKFVFPNSKVYLTIWAENGVGLRSDAVKTSVFLLPTAPSKDYGVLDIEEHSCDIHYCTLDCTCAVVGKVCSSSDIIPPCAPQNVTTSHLTIYDEPYENGTGNQLNKSDLCIIIGFKFIFM